MRCAKFQHHRTSSSGKEVFKRFLPYIRVVAILGHVTWTIYINFRSPLPGRLHIRCDFDWPAVSVNKMFENGGHLHVYSPEEGADNPLG